MSRDEHSGCFWNLASRFGARYGDGAMHTSFVGLRGETGNRGARLGTDGMGNIRWKSEGEDEDARAQSTHWRSWLLWIPTSHRRGLLDVTPARRIFPSFGTAHYYIPPINNDFHPLSSPTTLPVFPVHCTAICQTLSPTTRNSFPMSVVSFFSRLSQFL